MLQYVKKAVILQYYEDTIMEKGEKKKLKKFHKASPLPKSFWSWRGRLSDSSLAGMEKNSTDATLRKTQEQ